MKTKKPARKWLPLVAGACVCCALNLPAQTAPTITTQPASQTVLPGTNVTFTVGASGTGPFTYQWHLNGTNVPTNIFTVAGNGTSGFSGDGGPATNAMVACPIGMTFDAAGNFYFADSSNQRIRKVDTNGIITTVAGNGTPGFAGDGNAATNANLNNPQGVALDGSGNLFVSDSSNLRIRRVNTNGIITTVAGNGTNGDCYYWFTPCLATNAPLGCLARVAFNGQGNLFFPDYGAEYIYKLDANGILTRAAGNGNTGFWGDGSPAVSADMFYPMGLAFDAAGNLFLADQGNNRVRIVGTNGIINTFAGDGSGIFSGDGGLATNSSLGGPVDVTLDAAGNLYIADSGHGRVRMVDTNGIITTVAGGGTNGLGDGGPATSASLDQPMGVAVDASGILYVADAANRIRKIPLNTGYPTLLVANDSAGNAGSYTVVVTGPSGSVTSAVATLTVEAPPVITDQPAIQYAVAGGNPAFSVTVAGTGPFGYSWYLDTTNLVQSGTNTTLTLPNVAANEAGSYTVVITNAYGSVTSQVASLTLGSPPVITVQPTGQLALAGSNAVFSVTVASTAPFEYFWFFAETNAVQSGTTGSLTLDDVETNNAGDYTVVVTNNFGSATSQVAALAVAMPVITVLPASQIVAPGSNAVFSEAVVGSGPFGYLWCFDSTNLLQSGTNNTYTLSDVVTNNAGGYTVVVTNASGSVTSQVASLVVSAAPVITLQPASQTVLAGSGPPFWVTATGTPPIQYLWYFDQTNLVLSGTNSTLTLPGVSTNEAGSYAVVVTNAYGSATSQVATLTVVSTLLTTQPITLSVMPGTNFAFNASVPGPGAYSYQWQFNGANLQNTNFIITTVAGTNRGGYSGDGGAAINAELYEPSTVALDVFGNLFITDMGNCRIRKVDTNGIITTVAGTNSQGYSGDGGAAISAKLNAPYGVAFDASGNLYFADNQNDRIRKVDTNGIITTVAGTNVWGYSGDGSAAVNATLDRPQGVAFDAASNLYFADTENARIRKVDTNGIITTVAGTNSPGHSGDGGAAISAQLDGPSAVALDPSGNLYVAETQNARIRKVDTNGIITTVAGTNSPGFSGDGGAAVNARLLWPTGVALDASGNQYIADQENNRIRKVAINGIITTVAGTNGSEFSGDGGVAVNAQLNWPAGVALDAAGNLYIADSGNNRIREVFFAGYPTLALTNVSVYNAGSYTVVITNLAGSVTSAVATLVVQAPPVITVQPAGQVVLAASSPVLSVAAIGSGPFGYLFYLAGTNLVQDGTNSTLTLAAVSATNAGNYTVVVTNAWGSATSQVASLAIVFPPSAPPGGLTVLAGTSASLGATVAGAGPFTFQWQFNGTNLPNNIITTVAGNGTWGYSGDGGPATNGSLDVPRGLAFDSAGNLYIADENNQRIRKVNTSGTISTVAGNGIYSYSGDGGQATNANIYDPIGVSLDASENLYFGDSKNNRVRKVDTSGIITTVAGGGTNGLASVGAATNASLYLPNGPVLDRAGNLYFPDFGNYVVRKVDTNGIITTVAGNGVNVFSGDGGQAVAAGICSPVGIALDANDNLYIASPGDQRVRKVDTNGIITTVAGNGNSTSTGDDGPATNASLNPYSVAVNAFGDLYIPDIGNCRIRKVDNNGIITTVAGNGTQNYAGDGGPATNASLNHPSCVTFDAAGNLFIGDQNNNRIRKVLLYAGYPTFTLSNVLAGDAGSYSVVVTTPYGSVTSAVVTLNVALTQPQILAGDGFCGFLANQFGFNLCGATGQTIVVDGSADLVNWTPLFTNTCADANPFYFCDPCWTNFPSRFYRARLP